jgi:hypothetical protein
MSDEPYAEDWRTVKEKEARVKRIISRFKKEKSQENHGIRIQLIVYFI